MTLKLRILAIIVFFASCANGQSNIIIITTDGFRWQELFAGMDTALANNPEYNEGDSSYIYETFYAGNAEDRRKKLLPFTWSVIAAKGSIYGNRTFDNKVNNANRYWFSYPGYNEIMTGYPGTTGLQTVALLLLLC